MITITADKIAAITGGLLLGPGDVTIAGVSTDTRQIRPGDLFLALRGERYDAHDFLHQAVEAGAGALMVSRPLEAAPGVPVILVDDTLAGLQALAAHVRRQFTIPVWGVTGSSGKTTTKDMVAAVLASGWQVLKTRGNFNNEIGLPLTLLDLTPQHGAAVVEMGMRGPGEIDALCRLARPTGAIINQIGVAHLGRLGSVENIARAKGEILEHVPAHGWALLPGANPLARAQAHRCKGQVLYFGLEPGLDIYARDVCREGSGNRFQVVMGNKTCDIYLPLLGEHNILNALPAVGAGLLEGLTPAEVAAGLSRLVLSGMRTEILAAGPYTIINDAYNANPDSTCAALQTLAEVAAGGDAQRKVAVLGDMLELGDEAGSGHRRVGAAAMQHGVGLLVTVGELSRETAAGARQAGGKPQTIISCARNDEALERLQQVLRPGDVVLVKGSRGMQMEQIVQGLLAAVNV